MKNLRMKTVRAVFATLVFALLVAVADIVPVQAAVKLNMSSVNLCVGESVKLKVTGTSKKATWRSSNSKIVKVAKSGNIRAVRAGNATVTATVSGKRYNCKVKVNKTFKVEKTSMSIKKNTVVMAYLSENGSIKASVADKKICSVTFGSWDGDYMPLTIKPKKVGSTTIKFTNSANNEYCTLKVKVTAVPVIATFQTPSINTGAKTFVVGDNTMSFAFELNRSAKNTCFKIYNAGNEVVRVFDIGKLAANKTVSLTWDGLDGSGRALNGAFKYAVVADGTKTSGGKNTVYAQSPFGKGDGSAGNPFYVSNLEELCQVKNYNGSYFVQDAEIDFNYHSIEPLFNEKEPFTGTYDGKCNASFNRMINLYGYDSVFGVIGEEGIVKNVTMNKCVLNTNGSLLADTNNGTIDNCSIDGTVLCNGGKQAAMLVIYNNGQIRNCSVFGNLTVTVADVVAPTTLRAGGIAVNNTGMIVECSSSVAVSQQMKISTYVAANAYEIYGGGIVADNAVGGFVTQCRFMGSVEAQVSVLDENAYGMDAGRIYSGYIAGSNYGYIGGCVNAGSEKELQVQGI